VPSVLSLDPESGIKPGDRTRCLLDSIEDVLAIADLSAVHPALELPQCLGITLDMVKDEKTLRVWKTVTPSVVLRGKAPAAILPGMAVGSTRGTELLRGVLDLCLLAVIDEGPAYGYEMTKRLRERGLAFVGEGSIYPLLGRLERDGLVETYRAASNGGPPRKYYRPSSAGRIALALGVSEWRDARDAVDAVLAPVKVEVAT
jgi:PadR family transcriptional regulator